MSHDRNSLEVGTVVKIVQVNSETCRKVLKLSPGMEGIVSKHNFVFRLDEGSRVEQKGPTTKEEEMFMFQMPGSRIVVGPVARMPDDHKVVVWIVGGKIWNVTNVTMLFRENASGEPDLKWFVVRTGEILRMTV